MYDVNSHIFYVNSLQGNDVVQKLHIILIKTTFVEISMQKMFSELIEEQLNGISIIYFVSLDQNIIRVNNQNNIELFYQYIIDVFLISYLYIEQTNQYH